MICSLNPLRPATRSFRVIAKENRIGSGSMPSRPTLIGSSAAPSRLLLLITMDRSLSGPPTRPIVFFYQCVRMVGISQEVRGGTARGKL